MTIELNISYDISRNGRNPASYEVSLTESDEALQSLRQIGPVWNNIIKYRGVFPSRRDAADAALNYLATPCRLVERTDVLSGHATTVVQPLTFNPAQQLHGYSYRLLGSNLPTGRFVAEG